jgi:hypothetical protein
VISNVALALACFLGSSTSLAWLANLLHRHNATAGMIASVPAGVLACLLTLLTIYLAPPREFSPESFKAAKDLVYYGTLFVFAAVNGRATMDAAQVSKEAAPGEDSEQAKKDAGNAAVFGIIVMTVIWCVAVSGGFDKAARALMPDLFVAPASSVSSPAK